MKMLFRVGLSVASFLGSLLLSATPASANIVVSPVILEMGGEGSSSQFELTATVFGENTIEAYLVEVHQNRTGDLGFMRLEPNDPDLGIVKFDKPVQHTPRAAKLSVTGTVKFTPSLMKHTRMIGIYVVENPPKPEKGRAGQRLNVRVAYLIPIYTPRTEKETELRGTFNFTGLTKKLGGLVVNGNFANKGADVLPVTTEVSIRDSHNRLVEKVSMLPAEYAKEGMSEAKVYPRTEVDMEGPITKITQPGTYTFSILAKMGKSGKRTVVVTRKIAVSPEMLDNSSFAVKPAQVTATYYQGQRYNQNITIENPQAAAVIAVFDGGKVGGNGLTESKWGKPEIEIAPKSSITNSYSVLMQDERKVVPQGVKVTIRDKATGKILQETPVTVTFARPPKASKPEPKKTGNK